MSSRIKPNSPVPNQIESFLADVRAVVEDWVKSGVGFDLAQNGAQLIVRGKMLRSRLAAWIWRASSPVAFTDTLVRLCAATELVHTGSLYHDDVIDMGLVRRHSPALWRRTTPNFSILAGDLLYCGALDVLIAGNDTQHLGRLVKKVIQMCVGETKQELLYRGTQVPFDTCIDMAREKTGPLFAFAVSSVAEEGTELYACLEKAGYCIGTAYQLADDLVDEECRLEESGKTAGRDRLRGKYTLAHDGGEGYGVIRSAFAAQLSRSVEILRDHPKHRRGLEEYIEHELMAALPPSVRSLLSGSRSGQGAEAGAAANVGASAKPN